jgi:hypothetical protein
MTRTILHRLTALLGALVLSSTHIVVTAGKRAARSRLLPEMSMSMSLSMPSGSKGASKTIKGSKLANKSKGLKGCPPPKFAKGLLETLVPKRGKGAQASKLGVTCEPSYAPGSHGKYYSVCRQF